MTTFAAPIAMNAPVTVRLVSSRANDGAIIPADHRPTIYTYHVSVDGLIWVEEFAPWLGVEPTHQQVWRLWLTRVQSSGAYLCALTPLSPQVPPASEPPIIAATRQSDRSSANSPVGVDGPTASSLLLGLQIEGTLEWLDMIRPRIPAAIRAKFAEATTALSHVRGYLSVPFWP